MAAQGVRVNAIAPDVTQSLQVDYDAMVPEELRDRWPVWVPVGRRGEPEDSADVVVFLCSPLARHITGEVLNVNGGAIAMGHPLGATGAMIAGIVLDELERRGLGTALITLCAANGLGTATIIERV